MQEPLRVIQPPQSNTWKEKLRFYCQASSPEDPNLDFMASMWSYVIRVGEPHGKQLEAVKKYYDDFVRGLDNVQ